MSTCPNCHQPISSKAIKCSFCGTIFKAYGHPGITLYQAADTEFLCDTCLYHTDDTCNFPQRPYAKQCSLYQSPEIAPTYQATNQPLSSNNIFKQAQTWLNRHRGVGLLITLIIISLLITFI